jgi:cyclic beta-1,2-glucan synthetase
VGKKLLPNLLSDIDRWKILDNLRRSLLAPALLALFIAGWLWLPGAPTWWTGAGVLAYAMPFLTGFLNGLIRGLRVRSWPRLFHSLQLGALRWLLALAFILYETLVTLGGVTTTLTRMYVTRKHLLQWTSYADTVRTFAGGVTWGQRLAALLSVAGCRC